MALANFKEMINGSGFISEGFSVFFQTWRKMSIIKKIKNSHDYAWYNEYLKTCKFFKEFFVQACNAENTAIIPIDDFAECDADMLKLYLSEIFVSHNVRHKINEKEGVYIIQLTEEYLNSR